MHNTQALVPVSPLTATSRTRRPLLGLLAGLTALALVGLGTVAVVAPQGYPGATATVSTTAQQQGATEVLARLRQAVPEGAQQVPPPAAQTAQPTMMSTVEQEQALARIGHANAVMAGDKAMAQSDAARLSGLPRGATADQVAAILGRLPDDLQLTETMTPHGLRRGSIENYDHGALVVHFDWGPFFAEHYHPVLVSWELQ